jgi:regulator of nucleoside diphosphate kinase
MKTSKITITDIDRRRLGTLVDRAVQEGLACRGVIADLEHELERATPVDPEACPADLVTMNSMVRLRDLDRGEMKTYKLVYPEEAHGDKRDLSVLSPIGTAIIGCRAGDLVEWSAPNFRGRLRVEDVLYQPESAGAFDV